MEYGGVVKYWKLIGLLLLAASGNPLNTEYTQIISKTHIEVPETFRPMQDLDCWA